MLLVLGDWNAKVGAKQEGEGGLVGKHGLICERNDNGDRFVSFCACNNLAITSTMFPRKDMQKYTWTPQMVSAEPDRQLGNQVPVQEVSARHEIEQRS